MRRLFAILLAIIALLSLTACGNTPSGSFAANKDSHFAVIKESLKNYVVTAQNIAPNTGLKFVFEKNSKCEEFDTFIEKQNIEEIELYIKRIVNNPGTAKY